MWCLGLEDALEIDANSQVFSFNKVGPTGVFINISLPGAVEEWVLQRIHLFFKAASFP